MSKLKKRELERKGKKKQRLLENKLMEEHLDELNTANDTDEEV